MSTPAPGAARIGRYQLLERIPGGGMTEVWRARVAGASGPERPLVIKRLLRSMAGDARAEARFIEEVKIALALAHGNIVSTFEAGRDADGQPFLVMEYVPGHALRTLLATGPLGPELALFVAREVARALRYTHTFVDPLEGPTPIAHLDVSPENVLLSHAGQVKLTDFGIARAVGSISGHDGPYGKAPYAAPELVEGDPGGPPADVYGLGCVLYEMLTGRPPHVGADDAETLRLARGGPPPAPSSMGVPVGPSVDALVLTMVAREKADRYRDAGEVERALSTILGRSERPLTETELAEVMRERGLEARRQGGASSRLRDQLSAAGHDLAGHETTGQLLALGTVPLGGGDGAAAPAGAAATGEAAVPAATGEAHPPRRRGLWLGLGAVLLLTGGGAAIWAATAGHRAPDPAKVATPEPTPTRPATHPTPRPPATPPKAVAPAAPAKRPPRRHVRHLRRHRAVPRAPAVLQINAYPYANVRLDGRKSLGTTPLRGVEVPPGRHVLELTNPELKLRRTVHLDLKPGQHQTVGVRLDR